MVTQLTSSPVRKTSRSTSAKRSGDASSTTWRLDRGQAKRPTPRTPIAQASTTESASTVTSRHPPVTERDAHGGELALAGSQPALQHEATGAECSQGTGLLGQENRVPKWKQEESAKRPVAPLGQQTPQNWSVLVVGFWRRMVVPYEE